MNTATSTTVYERTLAIDASPETIWEFFVDPEKPSAGWGSTWISTRSPAASTAAR